MRSMTKWVGLLVVSVALVAANASAKQPGQGKGGKGGGGAQGKGGFQFGGLGGGGNMLNLLTNASVQTELKMTDDQKTKAQEFVTETNPTLPGFGGAGGGGGGKGGKGKGGGGGGAGFNIDPAAQAARTKAANEAAEKFAKANLKPEQGKRLKGIYYQSATLQVLATDEAAQKELTMTKDQVDKVKTFNADLQKDTTELLGQMRGGGGDIQELGQKMTGLRKDYTDKAVALLNDSQKKTWKDIVGEPFTVAPGGRRGGGGDN